MLEEPEKETSGDTPRWILYLDGSLCQQGTGVGLIIVSPNGWPLECALRFSFLATNNEAEYEALISDLKLALHLQVQKLVVYTDYHLLTNQVEGTFEANDPAMVSYLRQVNLLKDKFLHLEVVQIRREKNAKVDALSKLATSDYWEVSKTVFPETLDRRSILKHK
ncbi:RVT_3 domain-containing protein [Cephalotus follicularis]|uniref:RVT_3 domain-containing protein n=1 Tax=Cephalotus follicularis TaxID=3775 RepID=A0A1Q3CCK6_CEPFO|nr:RVT_3 domain-containing protein [Cephalotus follicularis]